MKLRKAHLRECGRWALEQRGAKVKVIPGAGIIPGARLQVREGSKERRVAVRTSLDRKVGLTRHSDGRWMTIPKVEEVIVVAPSNEDPSSAEVLSFDPRVMIDAFDAALIARKKRSSELSHKAPIFIALDKKLHGRSSENSGLKRKAQWRTTVPLASVMRRENSRESFVERVRREFAELLGVEVSKVVVEFRVLP